MASSGSSSKGKGAVKASIQPTDIVIPVMGETGSGKSTFISLCTGVDTAIGHGQLSYTSDIQLYSFKYKSQTVWLIDTPGFDDSHVPDTEILAQIAMWLGVAYASKPKILLNGILYLHPIHLPRMQGSGKRNLEVFKNLCGAESMQAVILATTFWEKVSLEEGERREAELVGTDEFWGTMVSQQSKVLRHYNTKESAFAIIGQFISNRQSMTLRIQREIIDENKKVRETVAGRKLEEKTISELTRAESRLKENQKELDEELEDEDERYINDLVQRQERLEGEIKRSDRKLKAMEKNFDTLLEEKMAQEEEEEKRMEEARKKHIAEMKAKKEEMDRLLQKHDQMCKEAEEQEKKMLAMERNSSALVLQRDRQIDQELVHLNTMDENASNLQKQYRLMEEQKRQMELQAFEARAQAQMMQFQMEERERYRLMQEAAYTRQLSTSQLKIMGGGMGIAALTFLLGPGICCVQ